MKVIRGDEDDWPIDRFSTTPRPSGITSLHDEVPLRRRQAHCYSMSVSMSTGKVWQYSVFTSTGFIVHTLHLNFVIMLSVAVFMAALKSNCFRIFKGLYLERLEPQYIHFKKLVVMWLDRDDNNMKNFPAVFQAI